jgi:putative Mn2+ efflux pump MntP
VLSAFGLWVGSVFGNKYKAKSEIAGGIVLILMGCKILIDHLGLFR